MTGVEEHMATVTGNGATLFESNAAFSGGGNGIKPHFKGTVGNAFAKGYPGLPHDEKNALRSEYRQPELTVYPDGSYELTTEPTIDDLPKDTVIFNEDQTKKILNNKGQTGNSFATGSNDDILRLIEEKGFTEHHLIDMDGNIVSQETLNEMSRKFASGVYDAVSPLREFSDKMEKTAKIIESASVVNNVTQQPINQTFNITMRFCERSLCFG